MIFFIVTFVPIFYAGFPLPLNDRPRHRASQSILETGSGSYHLYRYGQDSLLPGAGCYYLLDMAHCSWKYLPSWSSLAQEAEQVIKCVIHCTLPGPYLDDDTSERFSPYQIILTTLTAVYALRNLDTILGLGGTSFSF